jgi:hypothetical protein
MNNDNRDDLLLNNRNMNNVMVSKYEDISTHDDHNSDRRVPQSGPLSGRGRGGRGAVNIPGRGKPGSLI